MATLRYNPGRNTWSIAPASAATRAAAEACEVPRADVDAQLVESVERVVRMASATLGLATPPKVRWLPKAISDIRGCVYENPHELWIRVQEPADARNSALHELRHCWGLQDGRYEALGLMTMPERQRDADDFARRWTPSQELKSSTGEHLRHKTMGAVAEVKASSGGWEIAGLASSFANVPDAYGDVIARGCFARTIKARPTKFLFEHREPIGAQIEIKETAEGLWGRWSIVDTQAGTDARKLALAGVCAGLSIGFIPLDAETRADGVRVLKDVDLFEVSLVSIPAQELARVTNVKHAPGSGDVLAELRARRARSRVR